MKTKELSFEYPEELVALEPRRPSRVMATQAQAPGSGGQNIPFEITWDQLLEEFQTGDLLVLNDTRVEKRRVFALTEKETEFEILFIEKLPAANTASMSAGDSAATSPILESAAAISLSPERWKVLCPASRLKPTERLRLPKGITGRIVEFGRIQTLEVDQPLDQAYFEAQGEVPLPPYIQKARAQRHNRAEDANWYQTPWAKNDGSSAAPTASLHFSELSLEKLKAKGVAIATVTLHVGLGTYLPVTTEDFESHQIHKEFVEVTAETWAKVQERRGAGKRVWALGTTVARSLESVAHGKLERSEAGNFIGHTDLYILPGFEFKAVTGLLTNFHQPGSTLLCLVSAFQTPEKVLAAYRWAVEKKFRLFSYGDLSVWKHPL